MTNPALKNISASVRETLRNIARQRNADFGLILVEGFSSDSVAPPIMTFSLSKVHFFLSCGPANDTAQPAMRIFWAVEKTHRKEPGPARGSETKMIRENNA